MSFYRNKLWLFCALALICSITLLDVSALNCDRNGMCQCASDSTTTHEKFICDGEDDCTDGSDELNCEQKQCKSDEHKCKNGRCLPKKWTCDNYADCPDGSDEKMSLCNHTSCSPTQFRCHNGACIAGSHRCDRDTDCIGGEDENECVYQVNCTAGFFHCKNLKCVSQSFVCDGEDDCDDNTDESDCGQTCSPGTFTCTSGKCIPGSLKCNGKNDCPDGSDEDSCPTVAPPSCPNGEFFCDGECQPGFLKCDGDQDCSDGSDESSCDAIKCSSVEDLCDDGKSCIMKYKFCNGRKDCADGSDEKASICPIPTTTAPQTTMFSCASNEYKCNDSLMCIDKAKICDQNRDCPGGEDEFSCSVNECEKHNGNCSHICINTDTSYHCSCKHGFSLLDDEKTCQDIDECSTIGRCSQICTNTEGSYKCSCTSGYILSPNGRNCNPSSGKKEKLLVAVGVDVRSVSHDGSRLKCVVDKITKNVVAVAIHHRNNVMFWADAFFGKIFSSSLNSSHIKAKVVASGKFLRDLAIDWITGKLYWLTTSTQVSRIYVAELNGTNQKTIYSAKESIHGIAVDPINGYLYWTSTVPGKISRAYMDGERKEDIITTSIIFPTGLAIDFPNQKLLWSDSKLHQIASSDLDGGNRRRIEVYDVRHPVDVAVFGDFIYWSDSVSKTVSSANKFTGKNVTVIVNREDVASFIPKGISIDHALSQPQVNNPCVKNGGCSHLCLRQPVGFRCACPDNGALLPDEKNCKIQVPSTTETPSTTPSPPSDDSSITKNTSPKPNGSNKPTKPTHNANAARSHPQGSSINPQILGGVIAGVVFVILILVIVVVWCRRKRNTKKMEIYYSSEAANVKILPAVEGRNPTQSKKDVDRDAYLKFANQSFKEFDVDDENEDLDHIGEQQPVLKTFKQEDEEGLIGQMV